jgi:inhibitor of cysteine peptidase
LKNIAPGEKIYSARFVENKLYLVTFRQVDPFFVIDLSKPKKITLLGELKITGFSNYLHPYDENTIIGFGR